MFFWPLSTQCTVSLILDIYGTFMSSLTEGNEQFAEGKLEVAQQTFEYILSLLLVCYLLPGIHDK